MNYAQALAGPAPESLRHPRLAAQAPASRLDAEPLRSQPFAPASSLARLREWAQQLSVPGSWSPDAWRAVGLSILVMPDWPGADLEVEVQGHRHLYLCGGASTPRIHLINGQDARAWSVVADGAVVPLGRPGGDAFFEALVQGLSDTSVPRDSVRTAQYWRAQVARTLSDAVARWPDRTTPVGWLEDLLHQLPQPVDVAPRVSATAPPPAWSDIVRREPGARPRNGPDTRLTEEADRRPSWSDIVRRDAGPRPSIGLDTLLPEESDRRPSWAAVVRRQAPQRPLAGPVEAQLICRTHEALVDRIPAVDHEQGGADGRARSVDECPNYMDEPQVWTAVQQARAALDRGWLEDACGVAEGITPSFKTPIVLVQEICEFAVRFGQLSPAVRMLDRLARAAAPMFTRQLGYDPQTDTLDFHYCKLLTMETIPAWARPGHPDGTCALPARRQALREAFANGAATSALAEVLFTLHHSRKHLRPGTHLVVGEHGTGKLRRTMERCLRDVGWPWEAALYMAKMAEMRGRIVIAPRVGRLTTHQRWTRSLRYEASELVEAMAALAAGVRNVTMWDGRPLLKIVGEAYWHFGMTRMLEMMDAQPKLPVTFYERLFFSAVKFEDSGQLDAPVQAMLRRYGKLSASTWNSLMAAICKGRQPRWQRCQDLMSCMRRERVPITEELCQLMLQCVRKPWQIDAVERAMVTSSRRTAGAMSPALRQAFLRAAAEAGDQRRWDRELGALGGRDSPAFQAIRDYEVLLVNLIGSIDDAMALHSQLSQAGVRFSRTVITRLLPALWDLRRWQQAATLIQASIDGGDGLYVTSLGWEVSQGMATLRMDRFSLLIPNADGSPLAALTLCESMAIVALHRLAGRLKVGTLISLGERSESMNEPATRMHWAAMGLKLEPSGSHDTSVVNVWRVAELSADEPTENTNAGLSAGRQIDLLAHLS